MSGRVRACSSHGRVELLDGWELGATRGADESMAAVQWSPAVVPGTVLSSLREAGSWSWDSPRRIDAEDWIYRLRFAVAAATSDERLILGFEGLATFAQVWLNDIPLFDSSNMFLEHRCDVTDLVRPQNELLIRFSSLTAFLAVRRPRPRWRTPMVEHPQLRWVRTTLLGRTPGWSPPVAPVGPWRPVWMERRRLIEVGEHRLQASVVGSGGRLTLSCALSASAGATLRSARLIAERGGRRVAVDLSLPDAAGNVRGELDVADVDLWWPHTHGEPALYDTRLRLAVDDSGGHGHCIDVDLGRVGFRSVRLVNDSGRFEFFINERRVFCRGASWTPLDCVSLQAAAAEYRTALESVRAAGMNMLRVAGPLVYESDEFLDQCDALGILLWQDFMFANMDYPAEAAFTSSVLAEATQLLARVQARPSLIMLCGNSEGAQQAAMSGAPRECWAPPLFERQLRALANDLCPEVPYAPSSTHGGVFPFQASAGVTSYYGVGAYLLPLEDARRCELRFASECLAFANVPENETLALLDSTQPLRCHHPRWKERVPRDLGAGWDFDDVRDHYLSMLFRTDPVALRYEDHDRYLRLARAASGEVMAATLGEWRRARSTCGGALIWFWRDLWPGAGWGLIDSTGLPKSVYYYVKRVLQPLALFVSDEGTNGITVHIANDAPAAVHARLQLQQYRMSQPVGPQVVQEVAVGAASALEIPAIELYEGFVDLSHAYRFGPPSYDVLHAQLLGENGATLAETFFFPGGLPNATERNIGLSAAAAPLDGDSFRITLQSEHFAQSVHMDLPGFVADDQYFHLAPGAIRSVDVRRRSSSATRFEGHVHALNSAAVARIGHRT